ncbi:uncharacterized protein LOC132558396 [Ylistrum balloti]|uniref:uncharacterized protein LOC132558396 n=1 Tax=Ylistrum balloti TaxID=509963 RepID=UPI002905B6CF|nr:uncharacterized protein LOC132558396 [Ylistrum balloti]
MAVSGAFETIDEWYGPLESLTDKLFENVKRDAGGQIQEVNKLITNLNEVLHRSKDKKISRYPGCKNKSIYATPSEKSGSRILTQLLSMNEMHTKQDFFTLVEDNFTQEYLLLIVKAKAKEIKRLKSEIDELKKSAISARESMQEDAERAHIDKENGITETKQILPVGWEATRQDLTEKIAELTCQLSILEKNKKAMEDDLGKKDVKLRLAERELADVKRPLQSESADRKNGDLITMQLRNENLEKLLEEKQNMFEMKNDELHAMTLKHDELRRLLTQTQIMLKRKVYDTHMLQIRYDEQEKVLNEKQEMLEMCFDLEEAAANGNIEIVKQRLEEGQDPHQPGVFKKAAGKGHFDIVKLLLDKGVDPKQSSALKKAAKKGHFDIVKLLLDNGVDPDQSGILQKAATKGHFDVTKLLLEKGANPNQLKLSEVKKVETRGYRDIVKLLIDKGLRPENVPSGMQPPSPVNSQEPSPITKEEKIEQQQYTNGIAQNMEKPCNITITVVGHKGVGKSCFVKQLQEELIPEGGPEPTDTADLFINYMGYNPNTGFRQKLDKDGEMETGRQRLRRIIDRYRKKDDNATQPATSEQDKRSVEQPRAKQTVLEPDSLPGSPSPSSSNSAFLLQSRSPSDEPPAKLRRVEISDISSTSQSSSEGIRQDNLSLEQRKVIREIMKTETKENDEQVKGYITIYDFGGEKVFYNTHHCFMSSNMIFVLVFDVAKFLDPETSKDGYESIENWLKSITTYTIDQTTQDKRTPPVILVGSHLDIASPDEERQRTLFASVLEKLYDDPQLSKIMEDHVHEMFPVANLDDSSKNQDTYTLIWQKIIEIAPLQSQWEKPVPARWVALEHELLRSKNAGSIILTYKDLLEVNSKLSVPLEEHEITSFLSNLKFSGSFLCFDLHTKKPFIVLPAQWIIDAFKAVITDPDFTVHLSIKLRLEWTKYTKSGVLTLDFIRQLWGRHKEKQFLEHAETLKSVMETLGLLTNPLSDNPDDEVSYFIVPSMLQMATPETIRPVLDDPDTVTTATLCLKFDNPFIPQAVWDKMIAACIHRFHRLNEPGHDSSKFIQRGFVCLSINSLWNMIIHCEENAMKVTLFKKDTDTTTPEGAGVNLLNILEFLLRRILESNHQSHLKYRFYIHNNYRFTPDEKMVKVEELRMTPRLQCYSAGERGWIERQDLYVWFRDPNQKKHQTPSRNGKLDDLPDRIMTVKEIGRISRYIGSSYQMFFLELGCPIEVLEQELEEHNHLAFRSRVTKIFLQLHKMKAATTCSFRNVADAMSRNKMDSSQLQNIIDHNRDMVFKDDRLPMTLLERDLTPDDIALVNEQLSFKLYFNFFLELGFSPNYIDEFDFQFRNKKTHVMINAMLNALFCETKPCPNWSSVLMAMEECNMDTESLITALQAI